MNESKRNLKNFDDQNAKKQALREQLFQMQVKLRKMQVTIEQDKIKNENLQNVQKFETELRKVRDTKESEML